MIRDGNSMFHITYLGSVSLRSEILDQNATQYEMPRNQLDFTMSKALGTHWEIKFGIQDILNAPYKLTQDSNQR